ncbi:MAG TPA: 2-C-methyl-D-erythritol 4-phosphate cytidylyltransferase [Phycisphaerae bacterium]|nr:2-C-methyl-D-erythritol 4-phosphate cytidylyltransferase [Phycisphaerae bacterium]HNU44606.1 2-C-methyl-D-erythritol 4-phosphate cytidylyltransferase [Phycisphaerae bacterium]
MAKFSVIVAAAGKSERFGGSEKKTFVKLDGRAVFLRSVELFINRKDVCQTLLVVGPEDMEEMKSRYAANLGFMGVKVVTGGARRCDSVAAGLKEVAAEAEYVAVHDAARPCATEEMIDAVFAAAVKTGAAILASPLTGTIKRVSGKLVVEATVPRTALYEAQTPQVFKKDLLLGAYENFGTGVGEATDDAELVERTGQAVSVVPADASNLKITAKGDLALAQAILKARPGKAGPRMGAFEEAQW